jgi:UDP-N-acetylmuramoylalanine--D-glutamate ligase
MTLKEYLDSLQGRTVAVIGIGVSNRPLLETLLRRGISVTACDRKPREALGEEAALLERLGARLQLGEGYLRGLDQDVIFRTPGLRPDVPELEAARARGSTITSEMEVFFRVCPCPILAVTGSDGKTTTTTIIAELLKRRGAHSPRRRQYRPPAALPGGYHGPRGRSRAGALLLPAHDHAG